MHGVHGIEHIWILAVDLKYSQSNMVKADVELAIRLDMNDHIRSPICSLAKSNKAYQAVFIRALDL